MSKTKVSALDGFKLFYEEITSTKSSNRTRRRRPRTAGATTN